MFPGHNSSFSYHLLLCTFICCMRGKLDNEDSGEAVCLDDKVRDLMG